MPNFTGQLTTNEIFSALYNMIISQQVFADNIDDTKASLVDRARVDGTLYGDTKLYYATDVLKSVDWLNDAEAPNLLALHRPKAPEVQAIRIDTFRQISLTVDNYLSKRAWGTESAFSQFNSVMLGWIRDTKRVYDSTLYNTFIGTTSSNAAASKQNINLTLPVQYIDAEETVSDAEATNRLQAQAIGNEVANILVDVADVTRDFNDYGNLRSFNPDDLIYVWNSEWVNKITRFDLPTIFHKDELIDKFAEYTLPARYFGNVNTSGGTTSATNIVVRSLIETDYESATDPRAEDGIVHLFPGDLLPGNTAYEANTTYGEDPSIIVKIMHKNSVPYMSGFEVGTSFFNPKSLTENHYLTFGHNTLEYLKNYPFITVKGQSET